MTLTPVFKQRDFSDIAHSTVYDWKIESFANTAIGGPKEAVISALCSENDLAAMTKYLRCPIEIYDQYGRVCWWGYVNEARVNLGDMRFSVSLDVMGNRVAAIYSYIEPGGTIVGERKTTEWTTNQLSIDAYGTKDLYASVGGASDAQGTALRDTLLAQRKYPIPNVDWGTQYEIPSATLYCAGWWETLDWRQYSCAAGAGTATTAQISNGITSHAQFITAVDIDDASGVDSAPYRDGDNTLKAEVEELLKSGLSTGRRLLANVDINRRVRVYAEPLDTDIQYQIDHKGIVTTLMGAPVDPWTVKAGIWMQIKDFFQLTENIASPSPFFVETIEWDGKRLYITPRDLPDSHDIEKWIR